MFRNLDRGLHNRFYKISPRRPSLSASDGASGIRHRAESPGPRRAEPEKGARLSPSFAQPPLSARKRAMGEAKQHALSARKRMRSSYKKVRWSVADRVPHHGSVFRLPSCAPSCGTMSRNRRRPPFKQSVAKDEKTARELRQRQPSAANEHDRGSGRPMRIGDRQKRTRRVFSGRRRRTRKRAECRPAS